MLLLLLEYFFLIKVSKKIFFQFIHLERSFTDPENMFWKQVYVYEFPYLN